MQDCPKGSRTEGLVNVSLQFFPDNRNHKEALPLPLQVLLDLDCAENITQIPSRHTVSQHEQMSFIMVHYIIHDYMRYRQKSTRSTSIVFVIERQQRPKKV